MIDPPSFWKDTMVGLLLSDPRFWSFVLALATIGILLAMLWAWIR